MKMFDKTNSNFDLQVVIAMSTLALGVHMLCKSVIFAGDSPYLTLIQYRQVSTIVLCCNMV